MSDIVKALLAVTFLGRLYRETPKTVYLCEYCKQYAAERDHVEIVPAVDCMNHFTTWHWKYEPYTPKPKKIGEMVHLS